MVFWLSSNGQALMRQETLRSKYMKKFIDDSVEELEKSLIDLHNHAPILERTHELVLEEANPPHFVKLGVFDALAYKKGVEYACNLIDIKVPKKSKIKRINKYYRKTMEEV